MNMDEGLKIVVDGMTKLGDEILKVGRRVDRIERAPSGSGLTQESLGWGGVGGDVRDVLPEAIYKNLGAFDQWARATYSKNEPMSNGAVAAAAAGWFQQATYAGSPRLRVNFDESLFRKATAWLQDQSITKAAYAEGGPTTGQTLVPVIVEDVVIRQIKDSSKLFAKGRQFQMTTLTHDVPSESTAVTVGWAAEAGTLTGGEGTFSKKTLTAKKVYGRATMSVEMVEDSSPGLLQYLLEVFSEKIGGELDKQAVLGDGSSPAITGIDNTSGIVVISSSATAAGRNLTWQLLVNTFVGGGEGTTIENGVWIVSPKGYGVILAMTDSTGQPIIKFGNAETSPAGTLLGRPIVVSQRFGGTPSGVTATLDDSTNANTRIIFGSPSSLLCGTRQGLRWDVTDQVNWGSFSVDARLVGRFASVVGVPANFSRLSKVNTA